VAGADPHFEGFTRLHGIDPALSEDASMKKSIPRPIGEFDEAKALFGIEPLDDAMDCWSGGCLEPGLAKARSGAERARLWVVGLGVEVATPRLTEILLSHFGSWEMVGDQLVWRQSDLSPVGSQIVVRYGSKAVDLDGAAEGSITQMALRTAWIKGRDNGIVSVLIGLSAAFDQWVGLSRSFAVSGKTFLLFGSGYI
jgi:hypothetical protein